MKEKQNTTNNDSFDYKFALEQANHWIESADNKTGVALSLISITFTLYAGFLLEEHVFTEDTCNRIWIIILSLLSFALFVVSIIFFVSTLIPRLTKPAGNENPFYYREVASFKDPSEFIEKFRPPFSEAKERKAILESTYFNSRIALKKMKKFRIGLIFTVLFFVVSIACIVLVLFTKFPIPKI